MRKILAAAVLAVLAVGTALAVSKSTDLVIANSGSTNTMAWRIVLRPDGSGIVYKNLPRIVSKTQGSAFDVPLGSNPGTAFHAPSSLTGQVFASADMARKGNAYGVTCVKSASFGSTTRIRWNGWISPDIECPQFDKNLAALAQGARAIETYAGALPFHRVSLPNEPRRSPGP